MELDFVRLGWVGCGWTLINYVRLGKIELCWDGHGWILLGWLSLDVVGIQLSRNGLFWVGVDMEQES